MKLMEKTKTLLITEILFTLLHWQLRKGFAKKIMFHLHFSLACKQNRKNSVPKSVNIVIGCSTVYLINKPRNVN